MRGHDLSNLKFGKLIVVKFTGTLNIHGERIWDCLCDCGNSSLVKTSNLRKGKTKSCGCLTNLPKRIDLVGQRFNYLLVTKYSHKDKNRGTYYECLCDCGNLTTVSRSSLTSETTKSCGCWNIKRSRWGENNSNWNPDLSENDRIERRSIFDHKVWRDAVKEKSGYHCQICDTQQNKGYVAHHLDSYHACPEKRFDINNGICLCEKCHISFHKKYGYKNNTKQQFEEWKNGKLESYKRKNSDLPASVVIRGTPRVG